MTATDGTVRPRGPSPGTGAQLARTDRSHGAVDVQGAVDVRGAVDARSGAAGPCLEFRGEPSVTKGADVRVLRLVTVVLAWLLLVAGVAAGAWFAVDAAGRAVGGPAESADVVLPPPVDVSLTPVSTPGRSGTPSPTGSAGVTPTASPSPSSTGRRAFIVPGGSLVVRCQGTVLVYWSV